MQLQIATPEEMFAFGGRLAATLRAGDLIILSGPLGAGKTMLTKGIGGGLQVRGPITSPTFVIARTHPSLVGGPPLVHVDAYRLGGSAELDDLDIDFEHSVVVAEWGAGKFVETHESWIEIAIDRPGARSDSGITEQASENETDDVTIEPRTLHLSTHGARWQDGLNV